MLPRNLFFSWNKMTRCKSRRESKLFILVFLYEKFARVTPFVEAVFFFLFFYDKKHTVNAGISRVAASSPIASEPRLSRGERQHCASRDSFHWDWMRTNRCVSEPPHPTPFPTHPPNSISQHETASADSRPPSRLGWATSLQGLL